MKDVTPPLAPLKQPSQRERILLQRKVPKGTRPKYHWLKMGWINDKDQITEAGRVALYGPRAIGMRAPDRY